MLYRKYLKEILEQIELFDVDIATAFFFRFMALRFYLNSLSVEELMRITIR